MIVVGEMGINRHEFLYVLKWWEIQLIIKGYNRRHRDQWSAIRWQTYYLMAAQIGGKGMNEIGIHSPADLLPFPWDKEPAPPISEDDAAQLQAEMAAMNAQMKSETT